MIRTNIKVQRAIKRITQTELAEGIGLTRQTIHCIESGKTNPKISVAARLAKFFGMEIAELFDNEE